MFLYFFLSFHDTQTHFSISNGAQRQTASTHNNYKLPEIPKFETVKYRLSKSFDKTSLYGNQSNFSREILINVDDAAMFQLEALCVPEYSYCTYNLETGKIGFGSNQYNAYMSTSNNDDPKRARSSGGFVYHGSEDSFFNYYSEDSVTEEPYTFECPKNFYPQVLDELKKYISYEKNYLFNEVTNVFYEQASFIDSFINSAINNNYDVEYTGPTLRSGAIITVFELFMNDDIDIFQNSSQNVAGLKIMGALCWQMMNITNETF